MPPDDIWLDDEALADHFDNVKRKMRSGSDGGSVDIESDGDTQNDLTRGLRKG